MTEVIVTHIWAGDPGNPNRLSLEDWQSHKQYTPPLISCDEFITAVNEDVLVGLVMKLTGGSAIPAVVRAQIENARQRRAK